ncbi:MAG TPA: hypothetical protein VGJ02_04385, partial [Pyrinomonadaceae bacterium]
MKKFIFGVLCVAIFFVGLGSVVDKVGARFKSDQKALDLINAARAAIGGDSSIAGIQSLRIKGNTVNSWKIDGAEKTEPGEIEIAIQLPDKVSKMIRIGNPGDDNGGQLRQKREETLVINGTGETGEVRLRKGQGDGQGTGVGSPQQMKVIVLNNGDEQPGETATQGEKTVVLRKTVDSESRSRVDSGEFRVAADNAAIEARHKAGQQNELFRLTLGLLLSPPAGMDANYTFGGETSIDGTACNVVNAEFGGSSVKLFLSKDSNLPVQMTYSGESMPMFFVFNKTEAPPANGDKNVVFFRHPAGPETAVEQTVKFSDYRSVNGVQLPFHWS